MAHEINNPIGYVYSNFGSLERYVKALVFLLDEHGALENHLPEEARSRLDDIRKTIKFDIIKTDIFDLMSESRDGLERVKHIVMALRDFSHSAENEWREYDLAAGLSSTLNIVHNEVKYKAEVVKEFGGIPKVECMPMQINQVFMNIIINAAQAITERGVITIKTYAEDEGVAVEIIDTGQGIPPGDLKKIFDPFFTTKPVGQGTGLGLSLSYSVIQKHRGRLEVESEPGEGTRFKIWLPCKRKVESGGQ